ncbi:hypothetical protein FOA52_002400 [Chlamydomonas sp. UWO 241]|nr:hypothetical protein FOA52_002400 [Chlamydomonas sp. UWO 241]
MLRQISSLLPAARSLAQAAGPAQAAARSFADDASLLKTALYGMHVAAGGKMVPFAGWSMPIQYKDSIMDATKHCRTGASIFDVSHMCGISLKGKDTIPFIEKLVVGDIAALKDGTGSLSVYTNETGGIIDDTVITKVNNNHLYIVVNAGCREKDLDHLGKHLAEAKAAGKDVSLEVHDNRGLLAVQGPKAVSAVQALTKADLSKIYFSMFTSIDIAGIPVWVTRTGYTGEDGFEISVPNDKAVALAEALLAQPDVKLNGLGARDSLRLEAGLCLYGHDLTEEISPVEAGLAWTIGKRRREKFDFLGGSVIQKQLADGVARRRVGFVSSGAPAREHSKILSPSGDVIGEITSGGFSPNLKANISMGYIKKGMDKAGTAVKLEVRGKANDAVVTKMPFVPTHYYKPS